MSDMNLDKIKDEASKLIDEVMDGPQLYSSAEKKWKIVGLLDKAAQATRERDIEKVESMADIGQNSRFYEAGTNTTWSSACQAIAQALNNLEWYEVWTL